MKSLSMNIKTGIKRLISPGHAGERGDVMTKKDYELFANEIHKAIQKERDINGVTKQSVDTYSFLVDLVSHVFAKDNPLFQADKFERACFEGKHIRKSISAVA